MSDEIEKLRRGYLIAIEGSDRIGKTTLIESLKKNLEAKVYHFPTREGPIGELLDKYLRGEAEIKNLHSSHYLFSADRWEHEDKIKEILNQGKNVILDRYILSGYIYTICQQEEAKIWAKRADYGLIKPDVQIIITDDSDKLMKRISKTSNPERYESALFQKKINSAFKQEAQENTSNVPCLWLTSSIKFDESKLDWIVKKLEKVSVCH